MKPAASFLGAVAAVAVASLASADPSLISAEICNSNNVCSRVMVDKAVAKLYKTSPDGSIVINNSGIVDNEDEAKDAMRECNLLKRRYESEAARGTTFACRLEPADDTF